MRYPRQFLTGLTLLLTGGCSSDNNNWRDYFHIVRMSISGNPGVSRDQAAAIPYASLGYRVDGSGQALLVLATDNNGDLLWTSANRVVLLTRGGRIVRSLGLPHDIAAVTAQGGGTLASLAEARRGSYRSTRLLDLPDIGAYGTVLNCETVARGLQLVTILGTAITTVRIDETCRSSRPSWSFTDSYWIDPDTGFAWRSVQHLHPAGTTVQTEIFRPPE